MEEWDGGMGGLDGGRSITNDQERFVLNYRVALLDLISVFLISHLRKLG